MARDAQAHDQQNLNHTVRAYEDRLRRGAEDADMQVATLVSEVEQQRQLVAQLESELEREKGTVERLRDEVRGGE